VTIDDQRALVFRADQTIGGKRNGRPAKSVFDRIAESILSLENDPRPQGSRKLRGLEAYRLRVGAYRILYTIDDGIQTVEIIAVGHRKDVYR
jgi:mRNA interferase RelE/StbE